MDDLKQASADVQRTATYRAKIDLTFGPPPLKRNVFVLVIRMHARQWWSLYLSNSLFGWEYGKVRAVMVCFRQMHVLFPLVQECMRIVCGVMLARFFNMRN